MISVKYASIIAVAAFVSGSFIASPELRVYAANTVFSTDIKDGEVKTPDLANNAITSAKIKDSEVKAADIAADGVGSSEIATDAVGADEIAKDTVGASELKGVDKLIFADCKFPAAPGTIAVGFTYGFLCPVAGIDPEDDVIVTDNTIDCLSLSAAVIRSAFPGNVNVILANRCEFAASIPAHHLSIIVYDELPDKVPPA